MNIPLNHRLGAAIASVAITFGLFSAVAGQAEPPVAGSLLAQAAPRLCADAGAMVLRATPARRRTCRIIGRPSPSES